VLFGTLGAGLVVDWIALRDEYDPWDSAGIDAGWFFSNTLTTRVAKVAAGRERPFVEPCGLDPDYVSSCDAGSDGNASFFSGHASESATLAGLLCARHLHRRERGRADLAICGAAVAASAATGVLRITADQHWATDVLVGWISGGIFGYVLPSLVDYRGAPGSAAGRTLALLRHLEPMGRRATWGLRASFRF